MRPVERLIGRHISGGQGDRVCYIDPDVGETTYAQLYDAAGRYAGMLRDLGVRAGSYALVAADDSVATIVAMLGMWWNGCVPVPVSPMLASAELRFMAADCSAEFAHLDASPARLAELAAEFGALPRTSGEQLRAELRRTRATGETPAGARPADAPEPARWAADTPVLVQYTSGTTGRPKGVLHSVSGIEAVLTGIGEVLAVRPDDVVLSTAKLTFGYGFGNSVLLPLAAGARVVLPRGSVDTLTVSSLLLRHRPTVLFSVPRVYAALLALAEHEDSGVLDSVRLAVTAGEYCPAHLAERIREVFGVRLVNGLGATEVLHIVIAGTPGPDSYGAVGRPVPGIEATMRDEHGSPVPAGEQGRLHIAGASVALGYLNRAEATRQTFADGGVYTSDIVRWTADGEIQHLCRTDDILNLGGYKVAPEEIEAVVRAVDQVAECAVVSAPDENGLEQAVAYAVPTPGAGHDVVRKAILVALRGGLAAFKRPARVEVIDALPATSTGKLARHQLRETAGRR